MSTQALSASLSIALALLLSACSPSSTPRSVQAARMGRVLVFAPHDEHEGFVYLFSDTTGWNR